MKKLVLTSVALMLLTERAAGLQPPSPAAFIHLPAFNEPGTSYRLCGP